MHISDAAKASGVSAKMIRYYEQVGLMPPPTRSENGYRIYTAADVHALRFIRHARDLGFSVNKIDSLLALWRDPSRQSSDVKLLAELHMRELQQRIDHLQGMVNALQTLVACCAGDERPVCPILSQLEQAQE